jgi:hypothetical protein
MAEDMIRFANYSLFSLFFIDAVFVSAGICFKLNQKVREIFSAIHAM